MILRTYALYGANRVVLSGLALLLVAEIVIMVTAVNRTEGEFYLAFNNSLIQTISRDAVGHTSTSPGLTCK
jgi:hypothetical protein